MPGHEVVGRVDAVGGGVSKWKVGERDGLQAQVAWLNAQRAKG